MLSGHIRKLKGSDGVISSWSTRNIREEDNPVWNCPRNAIKPLPKSYRTMN